MHLRPHKFNQIPDIRIEALLPKPLFSCDGGVRVLHVMNGCRKTSVKVKIPHHPNNSYFCFKTRKPTSISFKSMLRGTRSRGQEEVTSILWPFEIYGFTLVKQSTFLRIASLDLTVIKPPKDVALQHKKHVTFWQSRSFKRPHAKTVSMLATLACEVPGHFTLILQNKNKKRSYWRFVWGHLEFTFFTRDDTFLEHDLVGRDLEMVLAALNIFFPNELTC